MAEHRQEDVEMKAEGKLDEMEGKAQEAWGAVTGDTSDKLTGEAKQALGKAKGAVGEAMDEVGDAADTMDSDERRR